MVHIAQDIAWERVVDPESACGTSRTELRMCDTYEPIATNKYRILLHCVPVKGKGGAGTRKALARV